MKRRSGVKPVNGARKAQAFARNYGPEAEALRALPCVVASRGNGRHSCWGKIEIAHVVARGMGGVKGGRFDIVPLCTRAHRNAGEFSTEPVSIRWAFEAMFDIDLRAEADRLALEHERPLGLRGVADRWAIVIGDLAGDALVSPYELDALAGWVTREMAREVERRDGMGAVSLPVFDREGLAHHIARRLGGPFADDHRGHLGLAWSLCEWATEGRWVS